MTTEDRDISALLDFLRRAGGLKSTLRTAWMPCGRQESTAEHSWRLCLFAMLVSRRYPDLDPLRILQLCVIHDLGETIHGDIPAPRQQGSKTELERTDMLDLLRPLPQDVQNDLMDLWEDYELGQSPEARLVKALDKLETMLQQTQGKNPETFDFGFNLSYGTKYTANGDIIRFIRELIDAETESCHLCQEHHKRVR